MDAPYITSEAQWDAFLAEFYPRLLKKIQAEATTVDSVEVYAPADYDEFAKRVKSLPARFDFQGVKKTVLVPLEILSRDHGLQLSPGATFRDALNARLLQLAEAGDPKAQEMVKLYGFDGKTTPIL